MPKVGAFAAVFDENDRILCVKINYGSGNWTLPGGHLEKNESPYDAVIREVLEETGFIIEIENLISVYSAPKKDDLVFLIKAIIKGKVEWKSNSEIQQIGFFGKDELPSQIHPWNVKRINDAYEGVGVYNFLSVNNDHVIMFCYVGQVAGGNLKYDNNEIINVKWLSIDEIHELSDDKLRTYTLIRKIISDLKNKPILPLDIINEMI